MTSAGVLRAAVDGFLLFLRGVRVLRVHPEGDGIAVSFLEPDKRHVHVTEGGFARWGLELHESVIQLAQDPRLLGRPEEQAERAAERAASGASARLTARWVPWNDDGRDAVDWVGVDHLGRPVVGVSRASVRLADVPALYAGIEAVRANLSALAPGARGEIRLLLATEQLDGRARALLDELGVSVETRAPEAGVEPAGELERRGRRRLRRRRPRRGDALDRAEPELEAETGAESAAGDAEPAAIELGGEDEDEERAPRRGRGRSRSRGRRGPRTEDAAVAREEPEEDREREVVAEAATGSELASEPEAEREALGGEEPEIETEAEGEGEAGRVASAGESAPEPASEEPEEEEPAAEEPPRDAPRRRRSRAALCVRNDRDAILAALVLARDRRHISFFYVCAQEELMDFFRGKAMDVDESTDLLLVGFTAEPIPRETIGAAELFRGRLMWFDAHDWPIEDVAALRAAIGHDSVVVSEHAATPLVPVMEACERRSRFTDKLVDLSGRRMSENDMNKWGYRLVGLLSRMTATGDHRTAISPILQGKPTDLPVADDVYAAEAGWLEENDPRIVHFGEHQRAVVRVPAGLDAGEVARRARLKTGARLSLAVREGDPLLMIAANEERRHVNLLAVIDKVDAQIEWAHARSGADRVGRLSVDALAEHPERIESVIGEIARHKSVLHG